MSKLATILSFLMPFDREEIRQVIGEFHGKDLARVLYRELEPFENEIEEKCDGFYVADDEKGTRKTSLYWYLYFYDHQVDRCLYKDFEAFCRERDFPKYGW